MKQKKDRKQQKRKRQGLEFYMAVIRTVGTVVVIGLQIWVLTHVI